MLSCLARSSASSSRACRACQRACPGDVLARSHARYPGPSRRDAHARRPGPSASPRRMHRAQAGAACVPLQCAACSLARRTRVCSPAWCVLLEPTLRITRGLVARGAVAAVGGTRRRAVGGGRWAVGGGGHLCLELLLHGLVLVDEGRLRLGDLLLPILAGERDPLLPDRLSLDGPKGATSSAGTAGAGHHRSASLRRPRGGARLGRRRGQRRASGWAQGAVSGRAGPLRARHFWPAPAGLGKVLLLP